MAKLPYGGHNAKPTPLDSWGFLEEIAKSLENGEPVSPQLARWLSEAIVLANRSSNKLLIGLDLKKTRGNTSLNPQDWLKYGEMLYNLESEGIKKEAAIAQILEESAHKDGRGLNFSRSTLQKWRKKYVDALIQHRDIK